MQKLQICLMLDAIHITIPINNNSYQRDNKVYQETTVTGAYPSNQTHCHKENIYIYHRRKSFKYTLN
ncbi:hypothetical protein AQUCO_01000683v1 [Aquilegia coerulea]|uniref:Uncharacterized protein n=1 Tax=Aquilegia coerulea TaxID=218851 RepID=A0A2G5EBA1_AQUCA|nr:hypothetical protein AQUCO_01000683v1 [Aquilegia coerulea]